MKTLVMRDRINACAEKVSQSKRMHTIRSQFMTLREIEDLARERGIRPSQESMYFYCQRDPCPVDAVMVGDSRRGEWLKTQDIAQSRLIETALIETYKIEKPEAIT